MCYLWLKFWTGEIIWGLIFLVCIKFVFETGLLIIWGLSESWSDFLGV